MSSNNVEMASLLPPWPEWLLSEPLRSDASVVALAERLFSGDINSGFPAAALPALLEALAGEDAFVHVWALTGSRYRGRVIETLGQGSIECFCPDAPGKPDANGMAHRSCHDESARSGSGLLAFSCRCADLRALGLPPTFLTAAGSQDRIGITLSSREHAYCASYPTYDEMLDTYHYVVAPGGFHATDCLILSMAEGRDTLAEHVLSALAQTDFTTRLLSDIAGAGYERISARS